MEDEERRNKLLQDLQIYIPFLEAMIANLENASTTQENPRSAQLDKMKSLLALLSSKNTRMKIGTLQKCGEVLRKLHEKMEMSGSSKLQIACKSKQPDLCLGNANDASQSPLNTILTKLNIKNSSAPASPSPPPFQANTGTPIIIPTERLLDRVIVTPKPEDLPGYKSPPLVQEDNSDLLFTRRQKSLTEQNSPSLFCRRAKSPTNVDSHLNHKSSFEYNNEWEHLTDDETDVLQSRGIPYNTPEPVRRSVFDRLGQKLSPKRDLNNSTCQSNFDITALNTKVNKIPKSAALITNITNQIKEARIKQDIESDIAVYLSESEKSASNEIQMNKTILAKTSPKPESPSISCGIRKSTPSLKPVAVRKLPEASIFGDVLSNIDQKLIDKVGKAPKRKSTESKQKKDDSKDIVKNKDEEQIESSSCSNDITKTFKKKDPVDDRTLQNPGLNISNASTDLKTKKSEIIIEYPLLKTQKKQVSEHSPYNNIIHQHNSSSSKSCTSVLKNDSPKVIDDNKKNNLPKGGTPNIVVNSERLSDKYPRKKSTDSNLLDNAVKSSPIVPKSDYKNSSCVQISNIDIKVCEKEKFINIPDVKSNDPRIKKNNSPQRNGTFCMTYDGTTLPENEMQIPEYQNVSNSFIFPSLVDMDYRYMNNANLPNTAPYQQPNVIPSNNFSTHVSGKQEFIARNNNKALLPTPNFGLNTYNDSNNCVNPISQDIYRTNSFPDNGRPDFYNEYNNSRMNNSAYNSYDATISNDSNIHEFNYSASYQPNNSRSAYCNRGRGGVDFKNNYSRSAYRWSAQRRDSSRSFDNRQSTRSDDTIRHEEQTSSNTSKTNLNVDVTSTREDHYKHGSKTPDRDRDFRNKSKEKCIRRSDKRHDSSSGKDIRETSGTIKSYKIPKIKRASPQLGENDSKATSVKGKAAATSVKSETTETREKKSEEQCLDKSKTESIDCATKISKEKSKSQILGETKDQNPNPFLVESSDETNPKAETSNKPNSEATRQNNVDQNIKSEELVNNEENALMAKFIDILTKVWDKKSIPNNDHLNMLQKLRETIDPKKFDKIQKILDADSDPEPDATSIIGSPIIKKSKRRIKVIESDSSDDDANKIIEPIPSIPVQIKKPKRRNALEMLQHDVRDMFISEGVLTATGRRMCRVLKEDGVEANANNKDEVKNNVINTRKSRGTKKVDYSEENDQNISIDEESNKGSAPPNEKMLPRILLQKLTVNKPTRGRNTARRGGLARSISRKCSNSEKISESPENSMEVPQEILTKSEAIGNSVKKCKNAELPSKTSTKSSAENLDIAIQVDDQCNRVAELEGDAAIEPTTEESASKTVIATKNTTSPIKKKLKRKGTWKMGKLRSKKKIKKMPVGCVEMSTESITKIFVKNDILNNDKDYFLDETEKYPCKLCVFVGKLITWHYVHSHPNKEVFVSRLNPDEAKEAVEDSKCNKEERSADDLFHFKCRFCFMTFYNEDQVALLEHLTVHTGEYRHKCNICSYKSSKMDSLKHHFKYRHKKLTVKLSPQTLYDVPNFPDCAYGYLCNHCNYTQILEKNVIQHSNDNHSELESDISKIPLYSFIKTFAKSGDLKQVDLQDMKNENDEKDCDLKTDAPPHMKQSVSDVINNVLESDINNKVHAEQTITDCKPVKNVNGALDEMPDKRPFLSVSESQFSKIELANSNEFSTILKPSFEPFTKKMIVTDTLQNKIKSFVPKDILEDTPVKAEPTESEPMEPESETNSTNDTVGADSILPTQEENIKMEENASNVSAENDQQLVSPNTSADDSSESCNSELNIWDEQDSNDSEHSIMSNIIPNMDEVLQNMEKHGKGSGNMSNTIHRLANSLIKSPLKSKNANNQLVNILDYGTESSLPPAEPLILNKELIKNTKLQIGTIRASITSENEIIYGCCEKGCVYRSKNEYMFLEHIKNCHGNSKWNGMCILCKKFIELDDELFQGSYPLTKCFQHITSKHKSDIEMKDITEPKPFLKMRRLSGDILSVTKSESENVTNADSQPFLKIASVVSLNADFLSNSALENFPTDVLESSTSAACSDMPKLVPVAIAQKPEENAKGNEKTERDVKPWINNSNIGRKNISSYTPEMLLDLYKCMSKYCTYTCTDKVLFQNHLMSHNQEEQKHDVSDLKADYLECSYCDKICNSIISLIGHIKNKHSACLYQCKHCFYRSFCKIYINMHIQQTHENLERPNILSLTISSAEIRRWKLSTTGSNSNVLPYQCKQRGCKLITFCHNEYAKHLESHNLTSWACFICNHQSSNIADLIRHVKTHEINIYQCCYCIYGSDTRQLMLDHLTSVHSGMPASTYMRNSTSITQFESKFELLKFNLETDNLSPNITIIKDINEITLDKTDAEKMKSHLVEKQTVTKNRKPMNEMENDTILSDSDSDVLIIDEQVSVETNNRTPTKISDPNTIKRAQILPDEITSHDKQTFSTKEETRLQLACHSQIKEQQNILNSGTALTEVVCAEDLSNESSKLSNEQVIENEDPLCIDEISFRDRVNTSLNEKLIASNGPIIKDSFVLVDFMSNSANDSPRNINNSQALNNDIQIETKTTTNYKEHISIKELIKDTGIECGSLFKCIKCDKYFTFSCDFKEHIMVCSKNETSFNCMHCTKSFKHVNAFVEHVKMHGTHRYSCGLCKYRSARPTEVKIHVTHKHKISNVEFIPLQPENNHPDIDLFTCQPISNNSQKSTEIEATGQSQMKINSFAPSDVDKLPRNSIYSKEVECALCSFKTKVRTNIIRHLKQHKSEQSVPEVCPVNPVPCLSSNERHFDKMTNLACSSHMHKTDSGKLSTLSHPKEEDSLLPKYVIESQRFVCGISGCTYLTVNEEMLRHHYFALHINETCYKCPHCPNDNKLFSGTINIEKIVSHLKLHDVRLYKCAYCSYHKSQKYIVERHIADKHPQSVNRVIVIREDTSFPSKGGKKELGAKLWVCGLCKFHAHDRTEIMRHAWDTHGMKSQYKCGLCQYRCSYKNSFTNHFASRHQGQPVNMVPVYRKIESNEKLESNSVVAEPAPVMDITPLWSREHTGQRYIRGILLEEESPEPIPIPEKTPTKAKKAGNFNKHSTITPNKSINANLGRRKRRCTINYAEHFEDAVHNSQIYDTANTTKKLKKQIDEVKIKKIIHNDEVILLDTKKDSKPGTSLENFSHKKENIEEPYIYSTVYKHDAAVKLGDDIISLSSSDEDDVIINKVKNKSVSRYVLDEGNYGTPKDGEYVCPFCVDYVSASDLEMYGHLCDELQYTKYSCSICKNVSWDKELLKAQCEQTHPNIIGQVKSLPRDTSIENWITKAIQHQRILIAGSAKNECNESQPDFEEEVLDGADENILIKTDKAEIPTSDEMYFCDLCSYSTKAIGYYERHKKKHMTRMYSCDHCSFEDVHKKKVDNHIKKKHPDAKIIVTDINAVEKKMPDVMDSSKSDLSREVTDPQCTEEDSDNSNIVYICNYCPKRGSSIADIRAHWEVTHKVAKVNVDGKVKKPCEFKYKTTTEQKLIEKGAKIIPKSLYVCQYCGKKGNLKVLQTHHKNTHDNMEMKLELCVEKPLAIKCSVCSFIVYSETKMKKHFSLSHNGATISYTKVTDNESSPNSSIEEKPKYECTYCTSSFTSLSHMNQHHETLHSHKSMVLKMVSVLEQNEIISRRQLFKCPTCSSAFESYNYICQHIETHVKPYICNYCPDGFSLPDTVKLHIKRVHPQGDINHYSIIANTQEILEATIGKIEVVIEDDRVKSQNELTKKRTCQEQDDGLPCKIPKNEYLSKDSSSSELTVRAVAKKSTTKLPYRKQVAKKSTSLQSVNITYNKKNIMNNLPVSHYKTHTQCDNSKIHTVISLGGKPMRVHMENLEAITNIYPKLELIDLKHQKLNTSDAFM